ncbi:MAG: zinc-dependent metalloprotease, partial [Chloroflexi bacterium]|nr:zinc-dependent metalloprotease [Chloroflexota bacterium]
TKKREQGESEPSGLIDWGRVRSIALALNKDQPPPRAWREQKTQEYLEIVRRIEPLVAEHTGATPSNLLTSVHVFDRAEWINANIVVFRHLFKPLEQLHSQTKSRDPLGELLFGGVSQTVLSGEMGLLLGYLAKRVLGQYDFSLLGKEPISSGRLYFVEPNISGLLRELGLPAEDFRLWIALHEATHAYEFETHPWLREHFNTVLESYFQNLGRDLKQLRSGGDSIRFLAGRVRQNLSNRQRWLELVMSPEQRKLFRDLQAMMCMVEGYSNHVMNAVGQKLLPSYELIKQRVEHRQLQKTLAERLFIKLTGLDMKMEQYRLGEAFVEYVAKQKGTGFVNRIWDSPASLPSMEEVRNPLGWIQRMERVD